MKINRIGYLFKEGVRSIFTHGFMSFASVTVIVACLLIMGTFSLLAVNVDYVIEQLEQENQILAFVDDSLTDEEALALQPRLESVDNVSEVVFVTREEAMELFVEKYEESGSTFEDVTSDFFRNRYIIYLNDISFMSETADSVMDITGVAKVNYHQEISQGFISVRNVVSIISVVLIVILFIVSVFIMANTIKLATYGRREEIAIMKMVGASNFFIRCPFVIEGLLLGIVGGGVAFVLEWLLYAELFGKVSSSFIGALISVVPFATLMWPTLAVFIVIGLVVGVFGSNVAIRNYLKV